MSEHENPPASDALGGQGASESPSPEGQDPRNGRTDERGRSYSNALDMIEPDVFADGVEMLSYVGATERTLSTTGTLGVEYRTMAALLIAAETGRGAGHARMLPVMRVVELLLERGMNSAARLVHDHFIECDGSH